MVDTGMHLRLSHQGSGRRLQLGPALPLVGRRRVRRRPGRMPGTPGVTVRLRVWAAWEICRIELAGVDWCDVAGVVELPLYSAEWRRVVE
jgi:hypothetical protein